MSQELRTLMLVGRPGSGKGTQARRIVKWLGGPERCLYIYAGEEFRKLAAGDGELTARMVKNKILDPGDFAPTFLAVWAWSNPLVRGLRLDQHILLDGTPRRALEARVVSEAMAFYDRAHPILLWLDIAEDVARERLIKRARTDDTTDAIALRIRRFDEHFKEIQAYIHETGALDLIRIDANPDPETIFAHITNALS